MNNKYQKKERHIFKMIIINLYQGKNVNEQYPKVKEIINTINKTLKEEG